jgi:hypothetical protein
MGNGTLAVCTGTNLGWIDGRCWNICLISKKERDQCSGRKRGLDRRELCSTRAARRAAPLFGPYGPVDAGPHRARTTTVRWCVHWLPPPSGSHRVAAAPAAPLLPQGSGSTSGAVGLAWPPPLLVLPPPRICGAPPSTPRPPSPGRPPQRPRTARRRPSRSPPWIPAPGAGLCHRACTVRGHNTRGRVLLPPRGPPAGACASWSSTSATASAQEQTPSAEREGA